MNRPAKAEPGSLNEHCSELAVGSAIAGLILLSPVVAFLMVIAAEMVIDLVMEARATAVCVVVAGAIGCVLFRKRSSHPEPLAQSGWEEVSDEAAIAPPPM
ncbi:MAG TPA: hypothetical protein VHT52_11855 [Stellaceae bacterium]|nr:hypothetical protein [Stellaceae bacterium]